MKPLKRELRTFGAVTLGLGSIIGSGVFVSIGVAAGAAGPAAIAAIGVAALVATCNALSSAQLAAVLPVSGGTYEYGNRYLGPTWGFIAGWLFLCAKTASAATASLGFAGYFLNAIHADPGRWLTPTALATIAVLTLITLGGMRRSARANAAIVAITLSSLVFFVVTTAPAALDTGSQHLTPFFSASPGGFLQAVALMFVAYTGYARITTLSEEVHDPERTIPRAIVITLWITAILYLSVATVAIATVGPDALAKATNENAAPLELVARQVSTPVAQWVISIGAMTAMLGVLLNLLLGLSRMLLAMARRGDMPKAAARTNEARTTPYVAVLAMGAIVMALASIGSVKTTWSFSAFAILSYYSITNLCALRLAKEDRMFSPLWAWGGLVSCLSLAFFVEVEIWATGLGLIVAGLIWRGVAQLLNRKRPAETTASDEPNGYD